MRVVWLAARSNLRRSWLVSLLLVAMIGVSGGAVLAAWVGAQRTGTAFERMLHETNAADVSVVGYGDLSKPGSAPKVFDLANLPQVARAGPYLSFGGWIPTDNPDLADDPFSMFVAAPVDDNAFSAMDRWVMLSGRLPSADAVDEIALNESAVESYRKTGFNVRVGDTIKVAPFELSALQAKFEEITRENREGTNADFAQIFRPISIRLVGIGRSPADVVSNANNGGPVAVMSRKYGVANSGRDGAQLIGVKLRSPGDLKAFERAAQALHPDAALTFTTAADQSRIFDSGSRPYTDALRLFSIVLGVTAALVLGQALARQVFADSGDLAVLRALGVTRRSLAAVAGLRSVVVGSLGATLALVIALSASGRFPIGPARLAEPHPGVRIAWGISVAGLLVLLFFVSVAVGPVAWRVARPIRPGFERERVRRGPRWLARASLPPAAAVGVRRALWPASRREPSIVVTVLGLGLALAALTVSVIFGASLGRMVDEPERGDGPSTRSSTHMTSASPRRWRTRSWPIPRSLGSRSGREAP